MIFGLGTKSKPQSKSKKPDSTKSKVVTKKTPKSSQADEAAAFLKKMNQNAKKNSDSCPFC